jgi:S1-C subfamily serine protease
VDARSPELPSSGEANPLPALLRRCVVRIEGDGRFRGTGFFVAPGEVLTCAHVVHGADEIKARWAGGPPLPATVVKSLPTLAVGDPDSAFYPLPDVALLVLMDRCVSR